MTAVVVTHNGGRRLTHCLAALAQQTQPAQATIVVDSGSVDGAPDLIRAAAPDAALHRLDGNQGPAAARNAGLKLARTPLVLLVDDDIYLAPDCLERLVAVLAGGGATVACPRFVLYPAGDTIQLDGGAPHFVGTMLLRHAYRPVAEVPARMAAVDACGSACLLIQRTEALAAGGFNEAFFFYFEDLEFSLRLRAQGCQIICQPAAVAYHDLGRRHAGLTFRGQPDYPPRRAYLIVRNRLLTILIHYRLRTLLLLAPVLLLYEAASALSLWRRGLGGQWARAWRWLWRGRSDIAAWRRQAQARRTLNDRDVLHGGALPLAPGFARGRWARTALWLLSGAFNLYWRLVRRLLG